MTTLTNVPRGRVFYQPEDVSEVLFLVKQGQVQLYRISPEGKKLVIAALGTGAIFGEMALLGQQMHNAFAEAMEDSVILVMSRADLERLILNKPILGLRMLEITGRRLSDAESRLEDMAFKGIPARLASLLLRFGILRDVSDPTAWPGDRPFLWADAMVTGLAIGGGAKPVHDLLTWIRPGVGSEEPKTT
jgi:CRP-like cAMP-binding protein